MKWVRIPIVWAVLASTVVLAAEPKLPVFTDITEHARLSFRRSFGDFDLSNIVEGTGGGAVAFDYNNDGLLDIYISNGCWRKDVSDNQGRRLRGKLKSCLYKNNGDGTFTDVTEKARVGAADSYGVACSAADYDNDGWVDLYVCCYGRNKLFHNNGDGTFTEVSERAGVADPRFSVAGLWIDYNLDGRLDLYVANYVEYDHGKFRAYYPAAGYPGPLSYNGSPNALYRNNGDGTFTDVAKEVGVYQPNGRAMGATAADFRNCGLLDIFQTNDNMENYYFENTGKGTFQEKAMERAVAFGEGGQGVSNMGPVFGDINHDGRLDLYIPAMGYGTLQINRGDFFEDRTTQAGLAVVSGQYTGWGACLFDYDNDGHLDLYIANGDPHHEYDQEAVLVRNDGTGHFVDVARLSGDYFHKRFVSRGALCADFDNDGDLDLLVINLNGPPRLLRNDGGNRNHWLMVYPRLRSLKREAIGARVTVRTGSLVQFMDMIPVRGYLSQGDPRLHFGLGSAARADSVEIRWPDGRATVLKDVPASQILTVFQDGS